MRNVIILRGLPGSGKTTFAQLLLDLANLGGALTSARINTDKIMETRYGGFRAEKLEECHEAAYADFREALALGVELIVVDNTHTQLWEFGRYGRAAIDAGYTVTSLICENRHGGKSHADVPQGTLDAMQRRFEAQL